MTNAVTVISKLIDFVGLKLILKKTPTAKRQVKDVRCDAGCVVKRIIYCKEIQW